MLIRLHALNIFAFSDTHGHHRALKVPEKTDILICAGDAVEDNLKGREYDDFIDWFAAQPGKWKIFVPGNHELSFDLGQAEAIEKAIMMAEDNDIVLVLGKGNEDYEIIGTEEIPFNDVEEVIKAIEKREKN